MISSTEAGPSTPPAFGSAPNPSNLAFRHLLSTYCVPSAVRRWGCKREENQEGSLPFSGSGVCAEVGTEPIIRQICVDVHGNTCRAGELPELGGLNSKSLTL